MPFNAQVFKTRALTAVVFVAVMCVGLFTHAYAFIALFTLVHFGAWYEYIKIVGAIQKQGKGPSIFFGLPYITMPILFLVLLALWLYPGGGFAVEHFSPQIPCLVIFSIWINDTMAYLVGSFLGKTPLSKISPKKTWEGTIGGVVLCVLLVAFLLYPYVIKNWGSSTLSTMQVAVVTLICGVVGTVGDLFESKLKRMAGIKDSGSFMPGHGGFLDRFDSLLFAVPAVMLYLWLAQ